MLSEKKLVLVRQPVTPQERKIGHLEQLLLAYIRRSISGNSAPLNDLDG